jgi:hypothetical protein
VYANKKMILSKLFQESGKEEIKENSRRVNSCMIYLIHCKNTYKCHDDPTLGTTTKGKKKKRS